MARPELHWLVVGVLVLGACPSSSEPIGNPGGGSSSSSGSLDESGSSDTSGSPDTAETTSTDETGSGFACTQPEMALDQLFRSSCGGAGCHGGDAAAGLDLFDDSWPEQLIDQPSALCEGWVRVVPGDPAASLLFNKVSDPECGLPMPVEGQLGAQQIACIEAWILGL